mmetsp:Transcript_52852/g.123798  ORF Transcript_52852/g.123798 Transcript_52852/m.123798 type:complete len:263 (-) Transcript_52852:248-1036(-)
MVPSACVGGERSILLHLTSPSCSIFSISSGHRRTPPPLHTAKSAAHREGEPKTGCARPTYWRWLKSWRKTLPSWSRRNWEDVRSRWTKGPPGDSWSSARARAASRANSNALGGGKRALWSVPGMKSKTSLPAQKPRRGAMCVACRRRKWTAASVAIAASLSRDDSPRICFTAMAQPFQVPLTALRFTPRPVTLCFPPSSNSPKLSQRIAKVEGSNFVNTCDKPHSLAGIASASGWFTAPPFNVPIASVPDRSELRSAGSLCR